MRANKEINTLTQQEVDKLPIGTEVFIIWSGGNGPYKYTIGRRFGSSIAIRINPNNGLQTEAGFIDHVGKGPLTEVWRSN